MDIMIDLETWSTQPDALVISIGAARFDPNGEGIADSFEVHIDPVDAARYGLHIDPSTVMWWMHEDRNEARKIFMDAPKVDCGTALDGFYHWLMAYNTSGYTPGIWGNGSTFDDVILRTMHEKVGVECPWKFWQEKCYRTIKSMAGAPAMQERHGTHHGALDDAISQALHLQHIIKEMGIAV